MIEKKIRPPPRERKYFKQVKDFGILKIERSCFSFLFTGPNKGKITAKLITKKILTKKMKVCMGGTPMSYYGTKNKRHKNQVKHQVKMQKKRGCAGDQ